MPKRTSASLQARMSRQTATAKKAGVETHQRIMEATTEGDVLGDLQLGPLEYRDPRTLTASPHNTVFDGLKGPDYWQALTRDISEAGAITDPLVVMPDGEIVSGHSRQKVAVELLQEGRREFEKVPVRVIRSDLSDADRMKRVYLSNLSRFEIDPDTRLSLYAQVYPEYYQQSRGRGQQTETVSVSEIAAAQGISERQVRNDRAVYQDAIDRAREAGKDAPDPADLQAARKARNAQRRQKATEPAGEADTGPDVDLDVFAEVELETAPTVRLKGNGIAVEGFEVVKVHTSLLDKMHQAGQIPMDGDGIRRALKNYLQQLMEDGTK